MKKFTRFLLSNALVGLLGLSGGRAWAQAPTNDNPAGAIGLTYSASCQPTAATTVGATGTVPNGYTNGTGTGCSGSVPTASLQDVWFTFALPANGACSTSAIVYVNENGGGALRARVFSASGSAGPFTEVGCVASGIPSLLTGLTPGTYYVSVANLSVPAVGTAFAICTFCPAAVTCPAPTGVAISNVQTTQATVSFTPGAGNLSYSVSATPVAGGASVAVTGASSPLTLTGLVPNTPYSVTVAATCAANVVSAASPATVIRTPLATQAAILAAQVGLYPNPAHHTTTLAVPATLLSKPATVVVLNAVGQVVSRATVPASRADATVALDLTELPAGLYLVQVSTAQGPLVKRLVLD